MSHDGLLELSSLSNTSILYYFGKCKGNKPGKNIVIDGSSVLIHTLAAHDLIDEYSLLVYPVVLGGGKKLFPDGLRANLRLLESRPFPSGVVLMRYVRA